MRAAMTVPSKGHPRHSSLCRAGLFPRALDAAPAGNYLGLIIAPRPEKELLFWLSIKQRRCYHPTPKHNPAASGSS